MFVPPHPPPPPNSYGEILTPKVIGLGDGTFWRWLGNERRTLIYVISALKERNPRDFPQLSCYVTFQLE